MTDTIDRPQGTRLLDDYVRNIESAPNSAARRALFAQMTDEPNLLDELAAADHTPVDQLLRRLGRVAGQQTRTNNYARDLRNARRAFRQQQAADRMERAVTNQQLLGDIFPELPDHLRSLVVPPRYAVTRNGIGRIRQNQEGEPVTEPICPRPIFITAQGCDISDNTRSVTLTWTGLGTGSLVSKTVGRDTICDSRLLTKLSLVGAPVSSTSVSPIIEYLSAFEAANSTVLPTINATKKLGWQHFNGKWSFLLYDMHIKPDDADDITLFPEEGMRAAASGWVASGSPDQQDDEWAEWCEVFRKTSAHPIPTLMVYASLASVFLEPLATLRGEQPKPFFMDLSGETSTGKTTSLRIAASVWGNPDESADGTIYKWSTTRVGIERLATLLNSLPLCLDETKVVPNKRQIAEMVYMISNGQGKSRGSPDGMRKTGKWRHIALSTGEQPLPSFSQDGGLLGRCVQLTGQPLRGTFSECLQAAADINSGAVTYYGQLGRRVATYLVQNRESWPAIKEQWEEGKRTYGRLSTGEVGGRIAGYVALLDVAKRVGEALGLPEPVTDPIETMVAVLRSSAATNSRPAEAFLLVHSLCIQHERHFVGTDAYESLQNPSSIDVYGRWDTHDDKWDGIYILKHVIERFLDNKGIALSEVLDSWYKRGMLVTDKNSRTRQIRLRGRSGSARTICFKRSVVEDVAAFDSIVTARMPVAEVTVPPVSSTIHNPPGEIK